MRRLVLAMLIPLLIVHCARDDERSSIVMIVIDTLRWDHVGVYGAASRDLTPALDDFARDAVRFERVYASAPWTRPSIGSMITGLHPSSHGGISVERPLPDEVETLAEILADSGYATAGIVSNWVIAEQNGFAQGFERYHEGPAVRPHSISSEGVTRIAVEMLVELSAADRPFLLFAHYFDPHYRYLPHDDVDFTEGEIGVVAERPSIFRMRALGPTLTEAELQNLRDLYAEEVRHTDAAVGELIDAIDALGLAESTVIAVASDHGEELFERGYLGHAHSLHEELLRVPLLIRAPGFATRVVRTPVSLVSFTPTLLELGGVVHHGQPFQADSLVPLMRGDASVAGDLFAEVDYLPLKGVERNAFQRALLTERYKLIHDRESGATRLYDVLEDPGEVHDRATEYPEVVAELTARLESHLRELERTSVEPQIRALSSDETELLRELGYVQDDG